ncbi:hypothetical protein AWB92_14620 [Mycobacterium sp. IEC1808]|nr:hypothetical protein AWB92_14620 [Mycobacterium sp. IEC1808]
MKGVLQVGRHTGSHRMVAVRPSLVAVPWAVVVHTGVLGTALVVRMGLVTATRRAVTHKDHTVMMENVQTMVRRIRETTVANRFPAATIHFPLTRRWKFYRIQGLRSSGWLRAGCPRMCCRIMTP